MIARPTYRSSRVLYEIFGRSCDTTRLNVTMERTRVTVPPTRAGGEPGSIQKVSVERVTMMNMGCGGGGAGQGAAAPGHTGAEAAVSGER